MKRLSLILVLGLVLTACSSSKFSDLDDGLYADIQTTNGDMLVELYYKQTPVTAANFVSLAEGTNEFVNDALKGKPYYDSIVFHRVIKGFMIQGGDPTGTGRGGPGYKFKDEIVDSLKHDAKGILSMANAGPGTNGSQFFITHDTTPWLNGRHTVFGKVIKGLEVVDSIANTQIAQDPMTPNKPVNDIMIKKVEIVRKGKDAKKFDANAVMTAYFNEAEEAAAAFKKFIEDTAAEFATQMEQAETTPSGLKYMYLKETEGRKPANGEQVPVTYAGYLEDGTLFDTNVEDVAETFHNLNPGKRDQGGYRPYPIEIGPNSPMIPGFREALNMMKVGERLRIFVPPHLGYGEAGMRGVIPPNSILIFDLEIVEE